MDGNKENSKYNNIIIIVAFIALLEQSIFNMIEQYIGILFSVVVVAWIIQIECTGKVKKWKKEEEWECTQKAHSKMYIDWCVQSNNDRHLSNSYCCCRWVAQKLAKQQCK